MDFLWKVTYLVAWLELYCFAFQRSPICLRWIIVLNGRNPPVQRYGCTCGPTKHFVLSPCYMVLGYPKASQEPRLLSAFWISRSIDMIAGRYPKKLDSMFRISDRVPDSLARLVKIQPLLDARTTGSAYGQCGDG